MKELNENLLNEKEKLKKLRKKFALQYTKGLTIEKKK